MDLDQWLADKGVERGPDGLARLLQALRGSAGYGSARVAADAAQERGIDLKQRTLEDLEAGHDRTHHDKTYASVSEFYDVPEIDFRYVAGDVAEHSSLVKLEQRLGRINRLADTADYDALPIPELELPFPTHQESDARYVREFDRACDLAIKNAGFRLVESDAWHMVYDPSPSDDQSTTYVGVCDFDTLAETQAGETILIERSVHGVDYKELLRVLGLSRLEPEGMPTPNRIVILTDEYVPRPGDELDYHGDEPAIDDLFAMDLIDRGLIWYILNVFEASDLQMLRTIATGASRVRR